MKYIGIDFTIDYEFWNNGIKFANYKPCHHIPLRMKRLIAYLFIMLAMMPFSMGVLAQDNVEEEMMEGQCESLYENLPASEPAKTGLAKYAREFGQWCKENNVGSSLEVGVSLSSTGLGLDLKTPVTKWVDIRAGIDWMPAFKVPMSFNLNTFSDGRPTNNFNHIASLLYNVTGIEMDETVHMKGRASMVNFKFFVDVYPVPSNRHWHVTAGFLAGSSMVGKAYNTKEEKPTLVGLNIYNRAYEYFTTLPSIFDVPLGGGAYMDPDLVEQLQEKFRKYGRMGVHIGDFKDGRPYIMVPAPDGSVSARAFVNHFKPYLGAGYSTHLDASGKWNFGVDLGVLFWGGRPDVINHDYATGKDINFTKDLVNIRGKVGDYMKIIKAFPVFPMLSVRFSYTIL